MSASGGTGAADTLPGGTVTEIDATSGVVAAAVAAASLLGAVGKVTWITGFEVTGLGATAATSVVATVTGPQVSLAYVIAVPAGVTSPIQPLVVEFPRPIPAVGTNAAIIIQVPSFGAGNTAVACNAHGFQK